MQQRTAKKTQEIESTSAFVLVSSNIPVDKFSVILAHVCECELFVLSLLLLFFLFFSFFLLLVAINHPYSKCATLKSIV